MTDRGGNDRGGQMTLGQLLQGLADVGDAGELILNRLALDCRQLRPGDVFVALPGTTRHGLEFLHSALDAGAVAVLYDGLARRAGDALDDCPVPLIRVRDLARQLPELARRVWGDPAARMDLIAVTGTNGKSSLAWLLAQALDGAMIGTLGVGKPGSHQPLTHTTPDVLSLFRLLAELRHNGVRTVVLEASSHALDQNRLAGLSFSSAIFTTLGHDHLDYHGDLASYGKAKARLFHDYPNRRQIINIDDPFGAELAKRLSHSQGLISYGIKAGDRAMVHGQLTQITADGLRGSISADGLSIEVRSDLLGRINFYNLLVVAAELRVRGLEADEISSRINHLHTVPGRMQRVCTKSSPAVIVDYAHTPDALENVLNSLREVTVGKLWCVFGCGGDRDRAKRPLMGRIAESLADEVVLTDDNPRHEESLAIIREIQAGMHAPLRCRVEADRAAAIRLAIRRAGDDDVVLIAGKGHETEQVTGDQVVAFSDQLEALQALEAVA